MRSTVHCGIRTARHLSPDVAPGLPVSPAMQTSHHGAPGFEHCHIGGVPIVTASSAELAALLVRDCAEARASGERRPRLVFDANGHALSMRETHPGYRAALDEADIIHADGGFLVTLSRWMTDRPIAERTVTTDLFHDFAKVAVANGLTFYLLGGTEAVNAACAARLVELHPGLRIAGRRDGYFTEAEEADVVAEINRLRPDILWVGLGKPKEQVFCARWRSHLLAGWAITCGGCFNYVAGDYPRAPLWMQKGNLEWLHRMATRPRHLFWRYMTTNPHALWIVFRHGFRPPRGQRA